MLDRGLLYNIHIVLVDVHDSYRPTNECLSLTTLCLIVVAFRYWQNTRTHINVLLRTEWERDTGGGE